ncbi:hypothetical protein [Streptomyces sp. NPDC127072]|uniref:hypothetical protein n=1 Tax=Streptomyces sp. NPDC127072 TaxID=3347129 RepID=UPI00365C138F
MDEHAEALEADLLRHYGVDLLDWHRGRLSSRRLTVLVKHLPRDSATLYELHGEAARWSATDYLLASAVDQLAEANWMFATVNRDEDSDPLEYPKPVPRPEAEDPDAEDPDPSEGASRSTGPASEPSPPPGAPARNPGRAELAQFFS